MAVDVAGEKYLTAELFDQVPVIWFCMSGLGRLKSCKGHTNESSKSHPSSVIAVQNRYLLFDYSRE